LGQNEKVSQRAFLDRCTPESGHCSARLARQKGASFGLMHCNKQDEGVERFQVPDPCPHMCTSSLERVVRVRSAHS
jgi:hypothetical protein